MRGAGTVAVAGEVADLGHWFSFISTDTVTGTVKDAVTGAGGFDVEVQGLGSVKGAVVVRKC